MAVALFDAQGCLTAGAFARIAAAPPGAAPSELAAHLASCGRCQRRLLATAMRASGAPTPRRERPPMWRTIVAVIACLLAVMAVMITMQFLSAGR
jgi:anti-sigma-K factor RskA